VAVKIFNKIVNNGTNLEELLKHIISHFAFTRLTLTVAMDRYDENEPHQRRMLELGSRAVRILRDAADGLDELGVHLKVHHASGVYQVETKVLVKPGWTVPTPHSARPMR
jgi:hypothetical protein